MPTREARCLTNFTFACPPECPLNLQSQALTDSVPQQVYDTLIDAQNRAEHGDPEALRERNQAEEPVIAEQIGQLCRRLSVPNAN